MRRDAMDLAALASPLLAFLLYYNALDAGFVYDDRRAILTNPDVVGHAPMRALFQNDFWGTPLSDAGSHGSYRPLCVATYRLNHALSGLRPWGYHLLNVLLHCSATALVVLLARRLLPRACVRVGGAVAGLTFAAHPVHTEAVTAVVGRADLAACNLFLLSFLLYNEHLRLREESSRKHTHCGRRREEIVRRTCAAISDQNFRLSCHGLVQQIFTNFRKLLKAGRVGPLPLWNGALAFGGGSEHSAPSTVSAGDSASEISDVLQWAALAGTLLLAAAATLCKEPGIMVIPLCIVYDFIKGFRSSPQSRWRSIFLLSVGGVTLLYWRLRVAGTTPTFATADNPTARDPSFVTRTLTFLYLPIFNFLLLIYPFHLSFDWSMDAIPRITSVFDPRNVLTATFYTLLSKLTWRALKKELDEDTAETKVYKRSNGKARHRAGYQSKYARGSEPGGREGKKQLCPLAGCRRPAGLEHTGACRSANNNNYMSPHSCVCPAPAAPEPRPPKVYNSARTALLIFVGMMTLSFVPASNAAFHVGFVIAERVLYLPSVGFSLLVGLGAALGARGRARGGWRRRLGSGTLLVLLLAMSGRTIRRNLDWRDEESLFRSALHINPPKAYGNLGSVLSSQGRMMEAESAFQKALLYRPNMADVHYNLGILLQNQRRYEAAIKSFERAIYFRPSMALAYVNLGASLAADGRVAEAVSVLRAGARADGARVRNRREHEAARVSALVQLAALHVQRAHWHKALAAYNEALHIIPDPGEPAVGWTRQSVLTMAGEVYAALRDWAQAERSARAALAAAPRDPAAHLAMAKLLARNSSRSVESEEWFLKTISLVPSDPSVREQYGQFLRSRQRLREASSQLTAAAQLAPLDAARAEAAARALRDARRCRAAERWYARAAALRPEDAQSHSNLGAILHLNGKYAAAAAAYRRALALQPADDVAATNLRRVNALMATQPT